MYDGSYFTDEEYLSEACKQINELKKQVVTSRVMFCELCKTKKVVRIEHEDVSMFEFCPYCGASIKARYGKNGSYVLVAKADKSTNVTTFM